MSLSAFRECKGGLTALKDQFWNKCRMRVTPITDNDVILWKVCQILRAKTITPMPKLKQVVTQHKCGMR